MRTFKCKCGEPITVEDDKYNEVYSLGWDCGGGTVIKCTTKGCRICLTYQIMPYPAPSGFVWDHIDRNIHNNLLSNLRLATRTQNNRNRRGALSNSSGYKGVTWDKKRQQWRVRIMVDYLPITIGWFDDPVQGAFEHNVAAIHHFGEFAFLNILPWPNNVLQGPPKQSDIPRPMMTITP